MEKSVVSLTAKVANFLKNKKAGLYNELKEVTASERRMRVFAKYLENNVPKKVLNRCRVDFSQYGRWMEATFTPKFGENFTEHDTLLITSWAAESDKWKFDKELSQHYGTWSHRMMRDFQHYPRGGGCYEVTFKATSEIDGCRMVKTTVTEERVVYKMECD